MELIAGKAIDPIPVRVTAEWCRSLRSPEGDEPCEGGLWRALNWIGDRESVLLAELLSALCYSDREWAEFACGLAGYGYGSGYGSGYGDSSGFGYGDSYGYSNGYGSGSGYGAGYGGYEEMFR